MAAKIITIANQKGGCGKTTITMQLAGILGSIYRVLIVDADPQGTATRWVSNASDEKPFPAAIAGLSAAGSKVHREVRKYVTEYDYILIDCPPAVDSPTPQSALLISDFLIIPVIPSPADLWAALGIQELVSRVQDFNERLEARIVANMCQTGTNLTHEAISILDDFGIKRMQSKLILRTAYRCSSVFGGTVFDIRNALKAQEEIKQLMQETMTVLQKNEATVNSIVHTL